MVLNAVLFCFFYTECRLCCVANKPVMLNVVMLSVVMLSVLAPLKNAPVNAA